MPKFTFGKKIRAYDPFWDRASWRIGRAAKILGFPMPSNVKWRYTDSIRCQEKEGESFPLAGLTVQGKKVTTIWVDLSRQFRQDTMIHEAVHAILLPIEDANSKDEHHAVFWSLYGLLSREYDKLFKADGEAPDVE